MSLSTIKSFRPQPLRLLLVFCCLVVLLLSVKPALSFKQPSGDNAVILIYHNVANDTPPLTSVSPDTFRRHMQYLEDNGYTVWPLYKTLVFLASGKSVPPKTVVITFDDAYRSVYTEAYPLLQEKNWPFTVFVTTKYINDSHQHYMTWDQLREIQQAGAQIGNHTVSHPHLVRRQKGESPYQWQQRISDEIEQAQETLSRQGLSPIRVLAYPYGEFSKPVKALVSQLGYYALGQHSGAVSWQSDFLALPRFPITSAYAELKDFALKVSSRNLPVKVLSPEDGILDAGTDIPELTLQLQRGDYDKSAFACYASGQGKIQLEWLNQAETVVAVRANKALKSGRTKYNCTAPSRRNADSYFWFSFLWMKPEADGRWYKE